MNITLFSQLFPKIGIDFGSSRVRVCTLDEGTIIDQPSCLAVNIKTKEVLAVGTDAMNMEGRVEGVVEVHWPIKNGVIYDEKLALALLKIVLQPILKISFLYTPVFMMSVPAASTQVDRENATKLLYDLGAKEVYTIAQPLAASIGAGVPIADTSGSFLFQLGADTAEAGVIALGSLIHFQSSDKAGRYVIEQIRLELQRNSGIQIGMSEATRLLIEVASLMGETKRKILVTGKDTKQGNPLELHIASQDIAPIVVQLADEYRSVLQRLLAKIAPELTIDIIDKGLLLSGGLAKLHGLDLYLTHHLGMPVSIVDHPDHATILGVQTALKHLDEFRESLGYVT